MGKIVDEFINTWGMYHFHPEKPENLIHADNLPEVTQMCDGWNGYISFGYLFQCVGTDGAYLRLCGDATEFRANLSNYVLAPMPRFVIGDAVKLKQKPELVRRVVRLHYHWQQKVVVYHVESSDTVGRTYWFEDQLVAVDR